MDEMTRKELEYREVTVSGEDWGRFDPLADIPMKTEEWYEKAAEYVRSQHDPDDVADDEVLARLVVYKVSYFDSVTCEADVRFEARVEDPE